MPAPLGILVVLDANGDGTNDLAKPRALYLNDGHGSFTLAPAGDYSVDLWSYTYAILAFDADGDGDTDLAVGNAGPQVDPCHWRPDPQCYWEPDMLYLNDGTGSFIRSPGGDFGGSGENDFDYTVALAAFDADGDGDLDLAEGLQGWCWEHDVTNPNCGGGGINVLFNDGAGVFTSGHSVSGWTTDFAAADFDADGDVDLAAANIPDDGFNDASFEPNLLFLNDGTGRFVHVPSAAFEAAPAGSVVSLDADGDGAADILLNTALYRSKLAEGACIALADAGFRLADDVDFGEFRVLASFDADGDGDADLVGSRQQTRCALPQRRGRRLLSRATQASSTI